MLAFGARNQFLEASYGKMIKTLWNGIFDMIVWSRES